MRRVATLLVLAAALPAARLEPQAVPEGSQAARVQPAYRRTPHLRIDPFRHVMIPHWGLVISAGALFVNNALSAQDVRAIIYLEDNDQILIGDVIDAFGLIPAGEGLQFQGRGAAGAHLGGPFGRHLSIGFSGQVREYGAAQASEDAVTFFRDGNATQQNFSLAETQGTSLTTGEFGAHAVIRFGPLSSEDGAVVSLGFGGRYVRPLFYAHTEMGSGSRAVVTGDSIFADVEVTTLSTPDFLLQSGAGVVGDFLVRLEWPTAGFAVEAMAANLGKVSVEGVERRTRSVNLATTSVLEVQDSLDASDFLLVGTENINVTLPRIVRFGVSGWANRILQLDASVTMPVSGEFDHSLIVDLGSTWRLLRTVPLRLGVVMAGHHRLGYTGGIAIEARNLFFQVAGASLGGLFQNATGVAARLELGFFF